MALFKTIHLMISLGKEQQKTKMFSYTVLETKVSELEARS